MTEENKNNKVQTESKKKVSRREILKGLATAPVLGFFAYDYWKRNTFDKIKKKALESELGFDSSPVPISKETLGTNGQVLKLGIIGLGNRGEQLLKGMGFVKPQLYNELKKKAKQNDKGAIKKLQTYHNQGMLNVQVIGICDVFDLHAEKGLNIAANGIQPNGESINLTGVKRYRYYQDLLANNEIDAIIISTPDFHHAQMTIDAVNAGKHVYCEKGLTMTEDELHKVYAAVKKSGVVFQLGHQYNKTATYQKAKEVVDKNLLGKITLIETTTNRNSKEGAWIRHLDENGNPKSGSEKTIDWEQWLGKTPKVPFSIERFYGWARWFAYDTGLAGQLFSHEIDSVNQMMGFSIPKTVTSSGGIYFHKEERDMPDTFHSVLEFPDKEFTMFYSASLASNLNRGRIFMGHDASMEVGAQLIITPDEESTKYKNKINAGIIDPTKPLFKYPSSGIDIDGITSASEKYYAERGLIDTNIDGKSIDVTHLHLKEWIDVIRNGGMTGCHIDRAFDNTIAMLMVHESFVRKRKVEWDPINRTII